MKMIYLLIIPLLAIMLISNVKAVVQSACGNFTTPNTEYTLNQSVSSTSTCFTFQRNNITLDLNGYLINYSRSSLGYGAFFAGANNSIIKNGLINEGIVTTSSKHPVYIINSQNNTIKNNSIIGKSSTNYAIYITGASSIRHLIEGNTINQTGSNGIAIYPSGGNYHIIKDNNIYYTATISAIRGATGWTNYTNNTIITTQLISPAHVLYSTHNNTLRENKYYTNRTQSLRIYQTTAVKANMNHSIDSSNLAEGKPINFTFDVSNRLYENVDFSEYGQVIFSWGSNLSFINSKFSNDGLYFTWINNSLIENSTFITNTSDSIQIDYGASFNRINNNLLNTTGGYNIYVIGTDNGTISNNIFYEGYQKMDGIYLQSGSDDWNISYNTLNGWNGNAIYIYTDCHRNIINNNYINLTTGSGIYTLTRTNWTKIKNNQLYITNGYGLRLGSTSCYHCDISNNNYYLNGTGRGISFEDTTIINISLQNESIIINGSANGLMFEGAKQVNITNIKIIQNNLLSNGINIYTSNNFNVSIKDLIIDGNTGASNAGVSIRSVVNNGTWDITNISQSNGTEVKIIVNAGANGTLRIFNYLNILTNYTNGSIANGFKINSTDNYNISQANSTTINGISKQILPSKVYADTQRNYTIVPATDLVTSEDYVLTPYPLGTIVYFRLWIYKDIGNLKYFGARTTYQHTIATGGGADIKLDAMLNANTRLYTGIYIEKSYDNVTFENGTMIRIGTGCLDTQSCNWTTPLDKPYQLNATNQLITYNYSDYTINASNTTTSQTQSADLSVSRFVYFTFEGTSGGTPVDACTYTSGNWNAPCSCSITSNVNIGGNNIVINGTGIFLIDGAEIRNYNNLRTYGLSEAQPCIIRSINGGGFK